MIYLLGFAFVALAFISFAAIIALKGALDMQLASFQEQAEANRKDRQSLTNSLLRDANKPVFDIAPTTSKPTQQWFSGKKVIDVKS